MAEAEKKSSDNAEAGAATDIGVPLDVQKKNSRIFASILSLNFLIAPVLYVGFVQAALCKRLGTSDTLANLPSTLYLSMAWSGVILAWLYPQARLLKRIMSTVYGLIAALGAMVTIVLLLEAPDAVIIGAIMLHALLLGASNIAAVSLNWEALGRGVSTSLRGRTLAIAFGWGPAFAVIGSLGAQFLLDGKLLGWLPPEWMKVPYPYSYAALFGLSIFTMTTNSILVQKYQFPLPANDAVRTSFRISVLGGLKNFVEYRVLLIICIAYLLVFCGNVVQVNMTIFTAEAVGRASEDLAGYQLALRFSFKMLAGFALGWLLTRTNPKAPLLVTAGLQILGVLWVLFVPGYWFLLAFAINGAGELFGAYYINYSCACSAKSDVRRTVAFIMLLTSLVGLSPMLYGWISDTWHIRASFWTALSILSVAFLLVSLKLPIHPRPREAAS
jgi:hypothetical protein